MVFNINEGLVLLKLAETVLILLSTDPSKVNFSIPPLNSLQVGLPLMCNRRASSLMMFDLTKIAEIIRNPF